MDVRANNRGRPHQKVRFSAAPVMGRNFLTQGRPGVRVRNVRGKSGPKSLCLCCFSSLKIRNPFQSEEEEQAPCQPTPLRRKELIWTSSWNELCSCPGHRESESAEVPPQLQSTQEPRSPSTCYRLPIDSIADLYSFFLGRQRSKARSVQGQSLSERQVQSVMDVRAKWEVSVKSAASSGPNNDKKLLDLWASGHHG